MDTKPLEDIGLTEGETKVYLALNSLGLSTTGPIVDNSGISASKAYNILDRLAKKGLVGHVMKGNIRYFKAQDPNRILDYIDEKQKKLNEQRERIKEILPELKLKQALGKKEHEATIYEGFKGVTNFFRNILNDLKKGEEYFVIGGGYGFQIEGIREFFENYHARRANKGIIVNMLANYNIRDNIVKTTYLNSKIKFLPQQLVTKMQITFYKNKTMIILWEKNPKGFLIESEDIVNSFQVYFNQLWNEETKTFLGYEGIKEIFNDTLNYKEVLFLSATGGIATKMPDFFLEHTKKRMEKGIKWKAIANSYVKDIKVNGKYMNEYGDFEYRYLPKNFDAPNVVFIYGNKVANVLWTKNPIVYVTENKDVAESYRKYFNLLWNQQTKTFNGFDGIKGLCEEVLETNHDLYLIGANGALFKNYPGYFNEFDSRRVELGIKRHHLSIEDTRNMIINKVPLTDVKYLPREFKSPMVIWIFGDKVAQIIWDKPELIFLVENKKIAEDYKKYFSFLWKCSKR